MPPIEDDDDRAQFLDPDEFGVAIVYNGVAIHALPLTGAGLVDMSQASPPAAQKTRRLLVRDCDIALPAEGDTVVIGAATYTVVPPIDDSENGLIGVTLEATA